jgi:hypothetical protein
MVSLVPGNHLYDAIVGDLVVGDRVGDLVGEFVGDLVGDLVGVDGLAVVGLGDVGNTLGVAVGFFEGE